MIKEQEENIRYLSKMKLEKTLPKLIKKLEEKRVVIYGNGTLFNLIKKYYDISGLNIVGVADKKYEGTTDIKYDEGYKVYHIDDISENEVDCILITVKYYIPVIEFLYEKFRDTNIKVRPMVKKPLLTILKEI